MAGLGLWLLNRTLAYPVPTPGCRSFRVCVWFLALNWLWEFPAPSQLLHQLLEEISLSQEVFPGEGKALSETKPLSDALRRGHKMTPDFWKPVFLGEI